MIITPTFTAIEALLNFVTKLGITSSRRLIVFLVIIFGCFHLSFKKVVGGLGWFRNKTGWFRVVSARFGVLHVLVCSTMSTEVQGFLGSVFNPCTLMTCIQHKEKMVFMVAAKRCDNILSYNVVQSKTFSNTVLLRYLIGVYQTSSLISQNCFFLAPPF